MKKVHVLLALVLFLYLPLSTSLALADEKVSFEGAKEMTVRVFVNGSVNKFTGIELDGDFFLKQSEIQKALDNTNLIGVKAFIKKQNGLLFV